MLIELRNITQHVGERTLFDGLNLAINLNDRLGLVGHNGSGKSTLLALLAGRLECEAGEVVRRRGLVVAEVEQFLPSEVVDLSVRELFAHELGAEAWLGEAALSKLGVNDSDFDLACADLSGGQRNRLLFARALARRPQLLLLDEPTNHLDLETLMVFERVLSDFTGAVVLVSHDRAFLDSVTRETAILRDAQLYRFSEPFSLARNRLHEADEAAKSSRVAEEKKIAALKRSAARIAAWSRAHESEGLARQAKSMEKRVTRLEEQKTFVSSGSALELSLNFGATRSKQILQIEQLDVGYPGRSLFTIDELYVRPGDRIALLGVNGVGKSTFIERLVEAYRQNVESSFRFSPQTQLGYYDQELTQVDGGESVAAFARTRTDLAEQSLRNALVHSGFRYEIHDQTVSALSGGERARLLLLVLALRKPNFLVLDEPTNHIDIDGKEQLEAQLQSSSATVLVTSHDRYFLDQIANRYWWIDGGRIHEVGDPEPYYRALAEVNDTERETQGVTDDHAMDERLLDRIEELEGLLAADLQRKPKFQKPQRQQAWRDELDVLYASLD